MNREDLPEAARGLYDAHVFVCDGNYDEQNRSRDALAAFHAAPATSLREQIAALPDGIDAIIDTYLETRGWECGHYDDTNEECWFQSREDDGVDRSDAIDAQGWQESQRSHTCSCGAAFTSAEALRNHQIDDHADEDD